MRIKIDGEVFKVTSVEPETSITVKEPRIRLWRRILWLVRILNPVLWPWRRRMWGER